MSERRNAKYSRISWDETLAEKVINLREGGMSCSQIAEEMETSAQAIFSFFNRLGRDKDFYLTEVKKGRQIVRKERMVVALAKKPRLPMQYKGELVAKTDDALPPLHMARIHLGKRFKDTDKGLYLDGREVGINAVMKATNSLLAAHGLPQVLNNPAWRVEG